MALETVLIPGLIVLPALLILYVALRILYNLFLHPLRSFPGPLSTRATILVSQKKAVDGSFPIWIHEMHLKYGPVIRHAPDELSFIDPAAWKDVYGHRSNFQKSKVFYGPDPYGNPSGMIRAEGASHGQQRKVVSHAFSDRALKEQEDLLKQYTDLLVKRLTMRQQKDGKVDMVSFYNFTTFDIMADLTFGEPLRLLEDSRYTPWVAALFGNIKMVTFTAIIRRWPLIESLLMRNLPAKIQAQRRQHILFSSERVDKRLQTKTERPDIWTYILKNSKVDANGETNGLLPHQMHSNAATFMLAGTETTATLLSGLTYFLMQHPEKLARLQKEVRGAFSSLDDVSMTTLSQLEYLHACIEEGLRVYPPVPGHLPRLTPNGGANIGGLYVPGGFHVSIAQYAAYHSPTHFKDPDAFVPERWMPEGQAIYGSDHREVVQPFSTGPRNCLGKNLAYHEMRLVLASIILSFDMELCEKETGNWSDQKNFILWMKPELVVKLTPVTN